MSYLSRYEDSEVAVTAPLSDSAILLVQDAPVGPALTLAINVNDAPPSVSLILVSDYSVYYSGSVAKYTITVTNNELAVVEGVVVIATLPGVNITHCKINDVDYMPTIVGPNLTFGPISINPLTTEILIYGLVS